MTEIYPWTFPAVTPGVLVPLARAIASDIAGSGRAQMDMESLFGYDVGSLAGESSNQFECAHDLIRHVVKDLASFHGLCVHYGIYHQDSDSGIYSVVWDDGHRYDQEKARIDAEDYASKRGAYITSWQIVEPRITLTEYL